MPLNYQQFICEASCVIELSIPHSALPDVAAALQLLESMAHQVMAFPLAAEIEPAPVFIP